MLTAGLLLMALVAAVAGLVAVAQTATRHYAAGAADQRTEAAVGLTRGGRVGARLLAAVPAAVVTGVLTAAAGVAMAGVSPPGSLELWELAAGRPPVTSDEVLLGTRLAAELHKGVGDAVTMTAGDGTIHDLAVVGVGVLPTFGSGSLGRNAALTEQGLAAVATETPTGELGLDVAPGVPLAAVAEDFRSRFEISLVSLPREVSNLEQIDRVPAILGGLLALLSAVTAVHTATMVARRARGDLAIARVLGFTTRQTARSLLVMALVVALVGVVVAVPLGMLLGAVGLALLIALALGRVLAWRNERARLVDTLRAY